MGMYATINGIDIKWSGWLAVAGSNIGIEAEQGFVEVPYSKLIDLLHALGDVLDGINTSTAFTGIGLQWLLKQRSGLDALITLYQFTGDLSQFELLTENNLTLTFS
jgi:hypothetical protein